MVPFLGIEHSKGSELRICTFDTSSEI
uniref:Uncharacterized protein n=1 Tax=Anguilla anguilla TaxID=7936 RepID=A0A0E9TH43_ANGAN